jgi:hypothetical protein
MERLEDPDHHADLLIGRKLNRYDVDRYAYSTGAETDLQLPSFRW